MEQQRLLAAFAHPDDEAFTIGGLLRTYADAGVHTALVCATRGEEGEISDPVLATKESLGAVREQELRAACAILGVADLSFLDYRDGSLAQANESEAIGRLVWHIRRLRPQVLITFDARGGYGHPDHIAIHRITVAAFQKAGDPSQYPQHLAVGLEPYAPQKLYTTVLALSMMTTMRAMLEEAGMSFQPGGTMATIPIEEMGTPDALITTSIPIGDEQLEAKVAAIRAHRTQMDPNGPFGQMTPATLRRLGDFEFLVCIEPPLPGGMDEHDLFTSVRL